jgi:alkylhydroperoxidase family enzyme
MASAKLTPKDEATAKVKALYAEIRADLGTDFIPNLYKAMASNPQDLQANWRRDQAVMGESKRLDPLTKEIIAVAVSAVNACD